MSKSKAVPNEEVVSHGMVADMKQSLTGLVVKRVFNIKADNESVQRKIDVSLDFSQCDVEWLLSKALRTIIIDTQRTLRQLGDEGLEAQEGNVKNILLDPAPTRSKLSDKEKAMRLIAKLDDEARAKLLTELAGK